MDTLSLRGIGEWCVFIGLLLASLLAAADTVPCKEYRSSSSRTGVWFPTPQAACADTVGQNGSVRYADPEVSGGPPGVYKCSVTIETWPHNGCENYGTCGPNRLTPVDINEQDAVCEVEPPPEELCKQGNLVTSPTVLSVPRLTTFVCLNGCYSRAQMAAEDSAGKAWVWGPFEVTRGGVTCDGSDDPIAGGTSDPPPLPDVSKPGECPGTVNGQTVYVPCSSTSTGSSSTTEKASTPSPGASAVPGDRETTRTETTCKDGVCSTTTTSTTTHGDGSSSSQKETKDTPQKAFCEENPNLSICKTSSVGGSCGSFSCTGDAIQCAIARASFDSRCEFFNPSGGLADEGASILASGPGAPEEHPINSPTTVDMSGGFTATSNLIGSGSCPADLSVPVPGRAPLVIGFAPLCGAAGWLGNLLVALTALACVGIVFVGGSNRD